LDLFWNNKIYLSRIPRESITIATDPGGNQICYIVSGDNAGKIYFWDHEEEVKEGEKPGFENMTLIAESFEEFLKIINH